MSSENKKRTEINRGRIVISVNNDEITISERPLLVHYLFNGTMGGGGGKMLMLIALGILTAQIPKWSAEEWEFIHYFIIVFSGLLVLPTVFLFIHKKVCVTPEQVKKVWFFFYIPYWINVKTVNAGTKVNMLKSEEIRTTNMTDWGMGTKFTYDKSPGVWLVTDGKWKIKPVSFFDGDEEPKEFIKVAEQYFPIISSVNSSPGETDIISGDEMYERISRRWPEGVEVTSMGVIRTKPRVMSDTAGSIGPLIGALVMVPTMTMLPWFLLQYFIPEEYYFVSLILMLSIPTAYCFIQELLYISTTEELYSSSKFILHKVRLLGIVIYSKKRAIGNSRVSVFKKEVHYRGYLLLAGYEGDNLFLTDGNWEMKFPKFQWDYGRREEILEEELRNRLESIGSQQP